jgi:lanosterol synthase
MPLNVISRKSTGNERTDYTRWRLQDNDSRHTWHYLSDDDAAKNWPQSTAEKYYLNLPTVSKVTYSAVLDSHSNGFLHLQNLPLLPKADDPLGAARNGLSFFENLLLPSGHWGCESGGPMTFCVGIVIAWFVTKTPIPDPVSIEIKRYLVAQANPDDGGWGLHTTDESNVCGTVINYCVLRLLGMGPDDPVAVKARRFLHRHGGAVNSSVWGKFWLSILGVMDWDAVNPLPSELWLLPNWMPIAPWRYYVEIRYVSLPMCYLYSTRWRCEETDIIRQLREEVFVQPFASMHWASYRNTIAPIDNKHPRSFLIDCVNWAYLNLWKPYLRPESLKLRAESWISHLIDIQDENTAYAGIAATDAPMNTIICYFRDGPESHSFKRHLDRLNEFLWMTDQGMLINSTNGSQSWDTALVIQAICSSSLHREERWRDLLLRTLHFLERHQIRENCVGTDKCYRQHRKGCWSFSNKEQGFPVSDCTAEALKAVILLQKMAGFPELLDDQRIFDAVDSLILYQNASGGVAAFETRRGAEFLEMLNPTEIFAKHMIDYDYPECTSSCVTALALFRQYWPKYRAGEIENFIRRGVEWIKSNQNPDGSWYGSWGICFTYATMFALECLASAGERYDNSDSARRGCAFLISKQRDDGGWSEAFKVSS